MPTGKWNEKNEILENSLTNIAQLHLKDWVDRLLKALWAYRITWRNTTRCTPYDLMYDKQVIFPKEIEVKNLKTALQLGLDLSESQLYLFHQISELDEIF